MMPLLMSLLLLAPECFGASSSVPFYNREMKSERDIGAVNENFRSMSGFVRSVDTRLSDIEDSESDYATQSGNNAFTGNNTHTASEIFSSTVSFSLCASSFTEVPGAQVTAAVFALAYATVTYISDGLHPVVFGVSGDAQWQTGASQSMCVDYLIDGAYRSGHGATGGKCWGQNGSLEAGFADWQFAVLSYGSHTIALMFREYSGATVQFPAPGQSDGTHSPVVFGAWTPR